jgi:hypothetical protein
MLANEWHLRRVSISMVLAHAITGPADSERVDGQRRLIRTTPYRLSSR